MLLSEPLASLITFFRPSSIKFYLNSQRMSDSFYHITESLILNVCKTRKFVMAILHGKQGLLCDKYVSYSLGERVEPGSGCIFFPSNLQICVFLINQVSVI